MQHFAVGVHPKDRSTTVIGQTVSGDAMVQIWSAPSASQCESLSEDALLPEMQLGLCHQGGLTWECKWCPTDTSTHLTDSTSLPR